MLTINRVFVTHLTLQETLPNQYQQGAFIVFFINHIDAQHITERSFYTEVVTSHVNKSWHRVAPLLYILAKMPVPYVIVMIAMFTKCLRPICHQFAQDCLREHQTNYQKQRRHVRDAILIACSKCCRSSEFRPLV